MRAPRDMWSAERSVAGHRRGGFLLEIEVDLFADVDPDAEDSAVGELVGRLILVADLVLAVIADADAVAAKREMPRLGLPRRFGNDLIVDVQLRLADRFAVRPALVAHERRAEHVLARRQSLGHELLFRLDAEEVVDVVEPAILDEQRMAAEARTVREDDAVRIRACRHIGEDLVRATDN